MILLDTDVLLIDIRYPNDARFPANKQALVQLQQDATPVGITSQTLLEVVGILSFNAPAADVPLLPQRLMTHYRLNVLPLFSSIPISPDAPSMKLSCK